MTRPQIDHQTSSPDEPSNGRFRISRPSLWKTLTLLLAATSPASAASDGLIVSPGSPSLRMKAPVELYLFVSRLAGEASMNEAAKVGVTYFHLKGSGSSGEYEVTGKIHALEGYVPHVLPLSLAHEVQARLSSPDANGKPSEADFEFQTRGKTSNAGGVVWPATARCFEIDVSVDGERVSPQTLAVGPDRKQPSSMPFIACIKAEEMVSDEIPVLKARPIEAKPAPRGKPRTCTGDDCICTDSCRYAKNGQCNLETDDASKCPFGTDCTDCGPAPRELFTANPDADPDAKYPLIVSNATAMTIGLDLRDADGRLDQVGQIGPGKTTRERWSTRGTLHFTVDTKNGAPVPLKIVDQDIDLSMPSQVIISSGGSIPSNTTLAGYNHVIVDITKNLIVVELENRTPLPFCSVAMGGTEGPVGTGLPGPIDPGKTFQFLAAKPGKYIVRVMGCDKFERSWIFTTQLSAQKESPINVRSHTKLVVFDGAKPRVTEVKGQEVVFAKALRPPRPCSKQRIRVAASSSRCNRLSGAARAKCENDTLAWGNAGSVSDCTSF